MDFVWDKPVLTFYRARVPFEREPFAVVKAKKLGISKSKDGGYWGTIVAFFPLMGNIDCISSAEGKKDSYVLCWFDDQVDDFDKAYRRVSGVTFSDGIISLSNERGKKTYETSFKAKKVKLE
jgi:hypothetical protein